jgi:hypothetical protein
VSHWHVSDTHLEACGCAVIPTRSISDVEKSEGFTRTNEDGREADFRLANRCIRLAVSEASRTYTDSDVCPKFVYKFRTASAAASFRLQRSD